MDRFRILVVDDDDDCRSVERWALAMKYEVVEASDGLDALEKLERAEPDFVILDVMMPLMDGYETCRAIRNHPRYSDVPVLFLSAKSARSAIKEGYGAGANLYLTKPFEPERLVKNVEYHLQESGAQPRPKTHTIGQLEDPNFQPPPAPAESVQPPREFVEARAESPAEPARPPAEPAAEEPVDEPAWRQRQPEFVATVQPAGAPPRPRVMVVDDNADVIELLSVTLGKDFEVTTAVNGLQAVERIILYQPDLLVLDAMLPKMSGYQLCTSLRRNQSYQRTPIVFISAKATPRDQDYCLRLGADEFVAKPFDPDHLRRRLLSYVAKREFRMQPKKLTLEQIHLREKSRQDDRVDREKQAESRRGVSELQKFIDREMTP